MKVVCINDDGQNDYSERVVRGRIYTVIGEPIGYKMPDADSGEVGHSCYDLAEVSPVSLRYGLPLCWGKRRFRAYEVMFAPDSAVEHEPQLAKS